MSGCAVSPCVGSVGSQQQLSCWALLQLGVEGVRDEHPEQAVGRRTAESSRDLPTHKKRDLIVKRMAGKWEEWLWSWGMLSAPSHPAFVRAPLQLSTQIPLGWFGVSHKSLAAPGWLQCSHRILWNSFPGLGLDWHHLLPSLERGAAPQLQLSPPGKHIPAPSGAQT